MTSPMITLLLTSTLLVCACANHPGRYESGQPFGVEDIDLENHIFGKHNAYLDNVDDLDSVDEMGNGVREAPDDAKVYAKRMGVPSFESEGHELEGLRKVQAGFDLSRRTRDRHAYSHNVTEGVAGDDSRLLLQQYVNMEARRHPRYQTVRVYGDQFNITRVEAFDLQANSSDAGYARIKYGGVGRKYVTLNLTSQRGRSLKYLVRIFGLIGSPRS